MVSSHVLTTVFKLELMGPLCKVRGWLNVHNQEISLDDLGSAIATVTERPAVMVLNACSFLHNPGTGHHSILLSGSLILPL